MSGLISGSNPPFVIHKTITYDTQNFLKIKCFGSWISHDGITNLFDKAQLTTASVTYGDITYRSGSDLKIDQSTIDIKVSEEAQAMLKRTYRKPYQHPYTS